MKKSKTYSKYRRKREGKTDYRKRLSIVISGKPRLVVRKSLTRIIAQIVIYDEKGDRTAVAVRSDALKKYGWNFSFKNITASYLLGVFIGHMAKKKGIKDAVLDIGMNKPVTGSRLFAVLKGAIDSGMTIPHSEEILPSKERLEGKHVMDYAKIAKDKGNQFSNYSKNKVNVEDISKVCQEVKKKILAS